MWLYMIALALLGVGIVGGILGGGIWIIILIPIGALIIVTAVILGLMGRAAQGGSVEAEGAQPTSRPLPTQRRTDRGRAPTSPERLADARRTQQ